MLTSPSFSAKSVYSRAARRTIGLHLGLVEGTRSPSWLSRGAKFAASPLPDHATRRQLLLVAPLPLVLPLLTQPAHADSSITKVFVAGSTGQTGKRVVYELRRRGIAVRAGVRDVKKAESLGFGADSGITIVKADVTRPYAELMGAIGDAQGVIVATGFTDFNGFNPAGFTEVDELGTKHLVDAAKAAGVVHMVLMSSLLTNAPNVGQSDNPNYKFLNLFGGVLDHKLVGEQYLRQSGLTWTVVRPGGLSNDPPEKVGALVVGREDTLFGLDQDPGREISRDTVAQVLVESLLQPGAANKVIEIVSSSMAPPSSPAEWFEKLA